MNQPTFTTLTLYHLYLKKTASLCRFGFTGPVVTGRLQDFTGHVVASQAPRLLPLLPDMRLSLCHLRCWQNSSSPPDLLPERPRQLAPDPTTQEITRPTNQQRLTRRAPAACF